MLRAKMEQAKYTYSEFRKTFVRFKIAKFKAKINFSHTFGRYELKTASTEEELWQVLQLRSEVFYQELGFGEGKNAIIDFDKFDLQGDHILLKDLESGKIVGTYRLLTNIFCDSFYSQTEFHLESFLQKPVTFLELGRACIHKDYRNGTSINLIWKGIGIYSGIIKARYLFGCASISSTNRMIADYLTAYFKLNEFLSIYPIQPTRKFKFSNTDYHPIPADLDIKKYLPPLLESYIKAGAKIAAKPAIDRKFKSIDFMTILDLTNMDEKYSRRYMNYGSSDTNP